MRNPNGKVRFNTFLSLNEKCSYLYYKLIEYSIDSLAHACALLKSKLPISNFRLLAIFVTDKAMVDVGFGGTQPTSKSVSLNGELSPSSMLAVGRTIIKGSIDISRLLLSKQEGKARSRRASAANAELHQLACVVPGDAPS